MDTRDVLGDRMKAFEGIESNRRAVKGQPLCARLDGRSFHRFTQGLRRPYDIGLSSLMIDTTKHLVEETQALIGYTQSDEISLVWYVPEESCSQYLFDGRFQKLASILSAYATGFFVSKLSTAIPEKSGQIPLFDCRVWQVPSLIEAYETLYWREKDAIKNSITMAASAHYSHKQLQGVNGVTKKDMLQKIDHPYETMPAFFRRGTYVQRVTVERMLTDEEKFGIPEQYWPTGPVARTDVKIVYLPEIGDPARATYDASLKLFFPGVV